MSAKNWTFTLNNYTNDEIASLASAGDPVAYIIYGKEVGESGTPHLQGFVSFLARRRLEQVKALIGQRAHVEVARIVPNAIEYCKKDGDYTEHGSPPGGAGSRSDLDAFKEAVKSGIVSRKELRETHSEVFAKYARFCVEYLQDNEPQKDLPTDKNEKGKARIFCIDHEMATPWQGEPALSDSSSLQVAAKKRQRTEPQQQKQKQKRLPGARQGLPTTGYDVLLVGERSHTQVLAKALLQASGNNSSSSSAPVSFDQALNGSRISSNADVDRLAIDALQRTLSNETSVSAIWKRRHVHMVESLVSTATLATSAAATIIHDAAAAAAANVPAVDVDVDRMNHIVIVVPTAFSPGVWETVPLNSEVQRELDAITSMSTLRESLLLRQRVSLVAIVGGANDSMATSSITSNKKEHKTSNQKAHSYVPLFLCHTGQDASFHCTARQLWKRIAIGTRTDPVSTVSPLLLARKYRE